MIRLWRREDIPRIAELEALCFREPWSADSLAQSFDNPDFELWVSEREGRIAAYAGFTDAAKEAQIANVATAPECRRQGLARELLAALVVSLRERGFSGVTLEVRAGNGPARELYRSLGFRREGVRPHFYSDGEDAEIYWIRFL